MPLSAFVGSQRLPYVFQNLLQSALLPFIASCHRKSAVGANAAALPQLLFPLYAFLKMLSRLRKHSHILVSESLRHIWFDLGGGRINSIANSGLRSFSISVPHAFIENLKYFNHRYLLWLPFFTSSV
jgi:hypothetical protein